MHIELTGDQIALLLEILSQADARAVARRSGAEDDLRCIENALHDAARDDIEHDGQPDEAQEWHDFDPDC